MNKSFFRAMLARYRSKGQPFCGFIVVLSRFSNIIFGVSNSKHMRVFSLQNNKSIFEFIFEVIEAENIYLFGRFFLNFLLTECKFSHFRQLQFSYF